MEFEKIANALHNERVSNFHDTWEQKTQLGEYIYLDYCIYCNINQQERYKNNANMFARWLKSENISLNLVQRTHLAKKYFGWKGGK
jgi:hypothetical protein